MGHNYSIPLAAHHGAPSIKIGKGVYKGSCNRRACQEPNAVWWNRGSYSFYCPSCAHKLNKANPPGKELASAGISDTLLCVEIESPYHPYHENPDAPWLISQELETATGNLYDADKKVTVSNACKEIVAWRPDRYPPDLVLSTVQDKLTYLRKIRK